MLVALGLVLLLLWLLSRVGRKGQAARVGRARRAVAEGRIEVVSRRSLGRHTSVAVLRVAGRTLVVGQTPQQVTVLTELVDDPDAEASPVADTVDPAEVALRVDEQDLVPWPAPGRGAPSSSAWDAFVDGLREMTVRH